MDDYRRADFRLSIPCWVIANENTHNVLGVPFGVALLQSAAANSYGRPLDAQNPAPRKPSSRSPLRDSPRPATRAVG